MHTSLFFATVIRAFDAKLRRSFAGRVFLMMMTGLLLTALSAAQTSGPQKGKNKDSQPTTPATTQSATEQTKKETEWDPSWSPLPEYGQPALPLEQVRETYAFAARYSEVLAHIPCYCGCENEGHKSVLDCFVKGRTKTGAPKWDKMGYT